MSRKLSFLGLLVFISLVCACSSDSPGIGELDSGTDSEIDGARDLDSSNAGDTDTVPSDTNSYSETDSGTSNDAGIETDTGTDTDTGTITDCALLNDFDPCGENAICFEGSCAVFNESVIDDNTSGAAGIGNLSVAGGHVWASHAFTTDLMFGTTTGHIIELADGAVVGDPKAEFEGAYAALAGSVAVGSPRAIVHYNAGDWVSTGDFADALAASETNASNTFSEFDDMTYMRRCDTVGCMEYTDNFELLGVNSSDEALVRRCSATKTLIPPKGWSCSTDIAIPESYNIRKLFALTSQAMLSEQYDLYALATKPAGYFDSTNALLKAENDETWTFAEQGAVAFHTDMGSPTDIHGTSPNNIWMVGALGFVAHWNGSELTEFTALFPYDSTTNRYNFSDVHVTGERVYLLGSRRDKKCVGDVCDAWLGAIIVVHDLSADHTDPATYRVHQLSGVHCHTDQGADDPTYKACAAISMADSAREMLLLNDEVYIVGSRWFAVENLTVARATIWHATL